MMQFITHAWVNRHAIRNYNVIVDLEPDLDITKTRKDYKNYILIDSLGLDSNGVNMLFEGTIDYTTLMMTNYKANTQ